MQALIRPSLAALSMGWLLLSPLAQAASLAADGGSRIEAAAVTDRLIIKYRSGSAAASQPGLATMGSAHEVVNRAGAQMSRLRSNGQAAHVMALDRSLGVDAVRSLAQEIMRRDSNVEYAEPDLRLQTQLQPNDPSYLSQWHYSEATAGLNLPAAWDASTGAGVVVAVVDTGYRPHADLAANILAGYDFISTSAVGNDGNGRDASALDPGDGVAAGECGSGSAAQASSWHGTHVAGTIAALTHNASGVAGVAFGAKVLPVRVLGKCGGYTSDIADGLLWAAGGTVSGVVANTTPARVINLSLGGSGSCGTTMQNAINQARASGAVVVVAAGNSAASALNATPANCHGVTTVAAANRSGGRAYYSNYGANVDLAAPGGDTRAAATNGILSTLNTGSGAPGADSYAWYQGTSMATPHVAGVAALMLARNPALTVEQTESLLRSSVRAFPASCSGCGTGLLDAALAVSAAAAAPAISATAVAELEPNGSVASAQVVVAAVARVGGTLTASSDIDLYRVTLPAGKTLTARLTPAATANHNLVLYSSSGSALVSSSNSGLGAVDSVVYSNNASAAVNYLVGVRHGSGAVGASYTLQLSQ
ncbi:S8 family peptidase [Aquabacterium sp. OR-4]|uniref:S8 family peptidase n=1 Tax=Aquabacterium sp. OR-4 TaxID=2978127 RepID=UPI0021B3F434|nr:S8 family peptidase [Aquabacterium sp. OR-4]MDT7834586.1 S8 family peptidase [Aquabacterium sp. OR-4]